MVYVTGNWRVALAGIAASLLIFGVLFFAVIQPSAVALYTAPPAGSPRNVWGATIADIDRQADRVRVRLAGEMPLVAEITPAALEELTLRPGDHVWASVKATEIRTYPA